MKRVPFSTTGVSQSTVYPGMPQYPGRLVKFLGDDAPPALSIGGSVELVAAVDSGQCLAVALASSVASPAAASALTLPLVGELAETDAAVVGGFHSPLERRCLDELTVAGGTAIVCLGRSLTELRIPAIWQRPLHEGKRVLVSACLPSQKRATRESVRVRNNCVLALADHLLIPHASPGGKTEALCLAAIKAGKTVWTIDHPASQNLVGLGAKAMIPGKVAMLLRSASRTFSASSGSGE